MNLDPKPKFNLKAISKLIIYKVQLRTSTVIHYISASTQQS